MSELFDLDEVIRKAVNREKLSRDLYKSWEGRFDDEESNRVIKILTKEEEGHIKLLEMVLADHNLDRLGRRDSNKKPQPVPRVPEIDEFLPSNTPKEIVAYAIRHEDRAIQYYSRYMDVFRDTPLFKFFSHMRKEEENHKERYESIFLKEYAGRKG